MQVCWCAGEMGPRRDAGCRLQVGRLSVKGRYLTSHTGSDSGSGAGKQAGKQASTTAGLGGMTATDGRQEGQLLGAGLRECGSLESRRGHGGAWRRPSDAALRLAGGWAARQSVGQQAGAAAQVTLRRRAAAAVDEVLLERDGQHAAVWPCRR